MAFTRRDSLAHLTVQRYSPCWHWQGCNLHRCRQTSPPVHQDTENIPHNTSGPGLPKIEHSLFMCHPFHRIRLHQPLSKRERVISRYEVWDVAVILREWFGQLKPDSVFHKSSTQRAFTDDVSIGRRTVASNTCPHEFVILINHT